MSTSAQDTTKTARRAFVSSLVGTSLEWYEFFIYGTAAALYFGPLFFPADDPAVSRLIAFATFGVAFIARPLGAVVFGHLGDRIGRRNTLIVTLSMMGGATGLIGLLPTYEVIGTLAPVLLVALRFLQGFAIGGEWGGAVLMAVENAPRNRVRLYGAAPQLGSPIGLILSTAAMGGVALLPEADRISWGWRVPFLLGLVLVVIALVIRLRVPEAASFREITAEHARARVPLAALLRHSFVPLLVGILLAASVNGAFYLGTTYMQSYAVNILGMEQIAILTAVMIAAIVDLAALLSAAVLADRLGARRVFVFGAAFTALLAFPLYFAVNTGNTWLTAIGIGVFMALGHATAYAALSSMTAELFDIRYRYTGTAATAALAAIIWGAPAPILAEAYVGRTEGAGWVFLPLMLIVLGSISLLGALGHRLLAARLHPLGEEEAELIAAEDAASARSR